MMKRRTISGSEVPGISMMILSSPCVRMDGSVRPNWSILFLEHLQGRLHLVIFLGVGEIRARCLSPARRSRPGW